MLSFRTRAALGAIGSTFAFSPVLGIQTSVAFSASGITTASAVQPSASSSVFIPDAASRVNVFVGTTNGGHVFPGQFACAKLICKYDDDLRVMLKQER